MFLLWIVAGWRLGRIDASRPWFLHSGRFTADTTIYEEAVSMLRAKGMELELDDALSILNRRIDLRETN